MDTFLNLKNNLIQNFYVVGLSPNKFFNVREDGHGIFLNIFKDFKMELKPEIISKFPPENGNFNSIKDDLVIAHCFPQGLHILQEKEEKKKCTHFEFHFDNFLFNYDNEEKRMYQKIYFTCLEFYESLDKYNNYKKEIIDIIKNDKNTNIEILKDGINEVVLSNSTNVYIKRFYIPKVICFASLLPFSNELYNILNIIYHMYSGKVKNSSTIPIETFIEQIILQIPIPITINTEINVSFKLNGIDLFSQDIKDSAKLKSRQKIKTSVTLLPPSISAFQNDKLSLTRSTIISPNYSPLEIAFPLMNINESFIPFYNTIPIEECFSFFQVDDIIKIFKYILLEVPILFFCSEKSILSAFIENFLDLLSPFNYVLPNISILPNIFYGLINSEPKFIFGINEKYTPDFFLNNKIDIDKNIIVVSINTEKKLDSKIEEILTKKGEEENNYLLVSNSYEDSLGTKNINKNKISDNLITNDSVTYEKTTIDLINLELPINAKKSLYNNLYSYINSKKKQKKI